MLAQVPDEVTSPRVLTVVPLHASLAVGGVKDGVAVHCIVAFAPGEPIDGAALSCTVVVGLPGESGDVDAPPQLILPLSKVVQVLVPEAGVVTVTVKTSVLDTLSLSPLEFAETPTVVPETDAVQFAPPVAETNAALGEV